MTNKFLLNHRVLWLLIPLLTLFNTSVWGALSSPSTCTFTGYTSTTLNSNNSDVTWTASTAPAQTETTGSARGLRWGGATVYATGGLTLTCTSFVGKTVTKIEVVWSRNNAVGATVSAKVDGSAFGSADTNAASTTNRTATFNGSAAVGTNITINATSTGNSNSFYIKSITVTFSSGCTNGTVTYSAGSTTYTSGNSISGSHSSDTKVCSTDLTLPGETFTTTGYTQDGWATSDGGSKVYNLGATNYSTEGNATLYPHWAANNYTVTWMKNGSQHTTTSVTYGSQPTLPSNPSSCDATSDTFYGWSTAEWSGTLDDVSDKTIYTDAFDMPAVTGDVTYYAVFAKAVKSDNFQLLGAAERFISGEDYLVEAYYSSTDHVLKAADYNSKAYQQVSENSWSLPSGGVNFDMSSRSALCIWKITSEGNNRFSFYNASDNKYLVLVDVLSGGNHYKNLIRSATKDATFIRTVVEGAGDNADKFTFESSSESGYYINSQTNYFQANATATQLYLYKRVTTYSKYLTSCCTQLGSINGSFF